MNPMSWRALAATVLVGASVGAMTLAAVLLAAGPLNPPAGPVASTYKTLTEVEPRIAVSAANTPGDADSLFKITTPGSYYLTGNITGVAGKHGIEIAASGVTLDLSGFELAGLPAMGAFDGVTVTVPALRNIAVLNGSVRNWGDDGVDLFTLTVSCARIGDIRASGNVDNGIVVGSISTVTNCTALLNNSHGIFTGDGCTLVNCSASGHVLAGFFVGSGSTVLNCSAYSNTGDGIGSINSSTVSNCSVANNAGNGIRIGSGCTITDCTVRENALDGVAFFDACLIRGNNCSFNGSTGNGAGIHAYGTDNRIDGNNCIGADRGIQVDAGGNIIIKNSCSGNALNWAIASGNVCLVVQGVFGAVISGNAGGFAPGSADPNANFSY